MAYGYIYKIEINNKNSSMDGCYYYGQSIYDKRYSQGKKHPLYVYFGSGVLIKKYIKKYGTFGLKKKIMCECNSQEELNNKENEYINNLYIDDAFRIGGKCLNLRAGGNQPVMSLETRRKMSQKRKNTKVSDEVKEKLRKANIGEHNAMYGKKIRDFMTEEEFTEYRKNMSKKISGKKWWNDGVINVFSETCPDGFIHGRLRIGKIGNNQYNKYNK